MKLNEYLAFESETMPAGNICIGAYAGFMLTSEQGMFYFTTPILKNHMHTGEYQELYCRISKEEFDTLSSIIGRCETSIIQPKHN